MRTVKHVALVTGASSGIGRELARLLARDGYDVVLVARNRARLEELSRELESDHQVQTWVIVQDLAEPGAPDAIRTELQREGIQVVVLVNNAGTQVYGALEEADRGQLLEMLQVNVAALTDLTKLFLPDMLAQGEGKILNLGSIGSFVPGPLNAVYCASKAYVLSFSKAIAAELRGSGVTVTALCPGPTKTDFMTRHDMQDVRLFRLAMDPVTVAEIGYRGMMRGRPVVVPGLGNRLQVLVFQFCAPFITTGMLDRVGRYIMGRA